MQEKEKLESEEIVTIVLVQCTLNRIGYLHVTQSSFIYSNIESIVNSSAWQSELLARNKNLALLFLQNIFIESICC